MEEVPAVSYGGREKTTPFRTMTRKIRSLSRKKKDVRNIYIERWK